MGRINVDKVLFWRFEIGHEVSLLSTDIGRVHIDFKDLPFSLELLADATVRRDKRSHDIDSIGLKFGGELLCRLDVSDPPGFGEILVAQEFSQEFAVQVNDRATALLQG